MFYTLTANPAVDMTVSSSPLEPDENVRTGSASYTANGKKNIILPEVFENNYNGKTYYQWKTERSK